MTTVSQDKIRRVALDLNLPAPNLESPLPSVGSVALLGGFNASALKAQKNELLESRNKAHRLARAILDKEDPSADDLEVYDHLSASIELMNDSLDDLQSKMLDRVADAAAGGGRGPSRARSRSDYGVRAIGPGESFAAAVGGYELPEPGAPGSLGAIVLGQVGLGPQFNAAQVEGTGSLGGYMVPSAVSARLIDLARNQARIIQAGAMTVPMEGPTLTFARWDEDPTAAWRVENSQIPESSATLSKATLTANSIAALVTLSVELAEDAPGFQAALESALAQALALELDRAALYGKGTAEPLGLSNSDGVNEVKMADFALSYITNYRPLSRAVQACWEKNVDPGAFILAPRTAGDIDRIVDQLDQPAFMPASVKDRQILMTNQVPTNLGTDEDETEIFTGLWSDLMLGIRTNVVLEASRVAGTDTFRKMQIQVRAYMRADALVVRPDHFAIVRGITAAPVSAA